MKSLTSTAVVALTAGLIAVGGMVPAASAQQQPTQPAPGQQQTQPGNQTQPRVPGFNLYQRHRGMMMQGMNRAHRGGGFLDLVCSDRAAERLEIALVRLSYRVQLTPQQQTLFDDLRTSALTAQTQFADRCAAAMPSAGTAANTTAPNPLTGIRARLELDKARIAAMETVLPKFEAFFTSLTDTQKAQLTPRKNRGEGFQRRGPGMGMNRPHRPAPGMMLPAPDQPPMTQQQPAQSNAPAAPQG